MWCIKKINYIIYANSSQCSIFFSIKKNQNKLLKDFKLSAHFPVWNGVGFYYAFMFSHDVITQ